MMSNKPLSGCQLKRGDSTARTLVRGQLLVDVIWLLEGGKWFVKYRSHESNGCGIMAALERKCRLGVGKTALT